MALRSACRCLPFLLVLIAAAGCTDLKEAPSEGTPADSSAAPQPGITPGGQQPGEPTGTACNGSAADIELLTVDRQAYDAMIALLRGKVVLVDFWATWCLPCIEKFPHTIGLQAEHDDLAVVTVSFDSEKKRTNVVEFINKFPGATAYLISEFGGGTQSADVFEVPEGVPHYKLYDRAGNLRYTFTTKYEQVEPRLLELLAEAAPAEPRTAEPRTTEP